MGELDGRVAIVTGAASGIGEASARALAAAGARVVVTALHVERAKVVSDSIAETGAEAMALGFDTSDEAQVKEAIEAVEREFGGVDILHNNAAITSVDFMMRDGPIHDLDVALWDETMAVNVRGYMLCTKHAIPRMLQRGGGAIINTASGAGLQGELVRSAYGTSKAAIIGFTRSVATQYGKAGIRCVTLMPGLILTPTVEANMPPPLIEMMRRHHLTPDIARPDDVAHAVVFLASDRAAFITGAVIPVDGGFSAHGPSYADEAAMWASASGAASAATADRFRSVLEARCRPALTDEDTALLGEVLTEATVWHKAADGGADVRGTAELAQLWNRFAKNGEAPVVSNEVYADADHVIGVVEHSSPAGPVRQAHVFHLDAEGKATEVWSLPADAVLAKALERGEQPPEHPNVARFRAAEEARARNTFSPEDRAVIDEFLREDVHWQSAWGQGPETREQVYEQFATFNQGTGGTMRVVLNELYADESHALSLVRLIADRPERPDKHLDSAEANVFHLDEDGRCVEFWGVAADQAEQNEFWTG